VSVSLAVSQLENISHNCAMLTLEEYHSMTSINITLKIQFGFFIVENILCASTILSTIQKAVGFKWKVKLVILHACAKSMLTTFISGIFWNVPSLCISCYTVGWLSA